MREPHSDAREPARWRRWRDIGAVAVLAIYALIAVSTQLGASVAGAGPDPVWAAARQRGSLRVAVDLGYYPFASLAGGEPAGYAVAYLLRRVDRGADMVLLYEISVAAPHRRRGLARAMVELLKGLGRSRQAMKLWVCTSWSNPAAVALYRAAGARATADDDAIFHLHLR